jgi:hypothetical protein
MAIPRIDYGNPLTTAVKQPGGTIAVDAYGLCQAQLTFAIDSTVVNAAITAFSAGLDYPDSLGFPMKSYKFTTSSGKAGVVMVTVDYMGIQRTAGWTDAAVSGIATTTAQPIETHPNFTIVTQSLIGAGSATQILAGPPMRPSTNANKPIFVPTGQADYPWQFDGFGLPSNGTRNIKAGVRQYLRPMPNIRGTIFFTPTNKNKAIRMANTVGWTLNNDADLGVLLNPFTAEGSDAYKKVLMTSANMECIGVPSNPAGFKVTYDLMIGGDLGWDKDIYGPYPAAIFS